MIISTGTRGNLAVDKAVLSKIVCARVEMINFTLEILRFGKFMNIKATPASLRKIYLIFGALTALTIVVGVGFYTISSGKVEADIKTKLEKVADAKEKEVKAWFQSSITDGLDLLNSMERRGQLLKQMDEKEKGLLNQAFAGWRKYLREEKGFVALYILDRDFKKIDTLSGLAGEPVETGHLKNLAGIREPAFSNFFSEKKGSKERAFVYLLIPDVSPGGGVPEKYLLVKIDPQANLLPRLWSATSILGSQENRLVVNITTDPLYHWVLASDGLSRKAIAELKPTDLAYRIEKGDTGFVSGIDYKGERSYAFIKGSEAYHFTLVAKISRDEILGPVKEVFWKALSGVALTLLILFISFRLLIKQQENQNLKKVIEAELEREKNEKLLEAIIESSPDAIMLIDPKKGELTRFNKRADEMFALHLAGPVVKLSPAKFHKSPLTDEESREQMKVLLEEKIWRGDVEYRSLDGNAFWGNVVVSVIEAGGESFYMARVADITKSKNLLTELQELTSELKRIDEEKVKFMSVLAHDLRSPFHPLLNILDLLNNDYDNMSEEDRRNFMKDAYEIAGRHFEFLESLLTWSRASLGKISFNPQPLSPFAIISETVQLQEHLATEKGIRITTKVTSTNEVNADAEMLRTILRNLIANAIKFTHPKGMVTVSAATEDNLVVFSVTDTGVGIPQDQLGKLFSLEGSRSTPGTGNERGTGLGLLLCKEFVYMHGGTMSVESTPENGSTFRFTIPVYRNG